MHNSRAHDKRKFAQVAGKNIYIHMLNKTPKGVKRVQNIDNTKSWLEKHPVNLCAF